MRVRLAFVLLVVSSACVPRLAAGAPAPEDYVFAVVPQAPPVVMSALWSPIVERVAREARAPLRMKLYEHAEAFQNDLAAGAPDLAYLNPMQAIHAHRAARYRPLVRNHKPVRGVFFVARDSPFTSVTSLAGREVAFMGPWTFCSVTLRHEVRDLGIVPRYVGTAANTFKHVVIGLTPAGGILDVALDEEPAEVRQKLRVILRTPPMAPHAVVAHPRVPREVAGRVAAALQALAATEVGSKLLAPVHMETPVVAEYLRDYAPLERVLDDMSDARPAGGAE